MSPEDQDQELTEGAAPEDVALDMPGPLPIIHENVDSHERMRDAIVTRTRELLAGIGTPEDIIDPLGLNLTEWVDGMLLKFRAGQLEHGGDIRDRPLRHEMIAEIRDLSIYTICEDLPPKPITV